MATILALVALVGAGLVAWGLPVSRPLGVPGTFNESAATATDLAAALSSNSPALASDPTDDRVVAMANRIDSPAPGCALQMSGDGGESWVGADSVPRFPARVSGCHSPDLAFDGAGRLHYVFAGHDSDGRTLGYYLTTSADRARSFGPPVPVSGPDSYGMRIASDRSGGRLHVVWIEAGAPATPSGFEAANAIATAHSDDGGRTFSEPVRITTSDSPRVVAPTIATGSGGRVHVAYYDLGDDERDYRGLDGPVWDGRWQLMVATSDDRGSDFAPAEVVEMVVPPARVASAPRMAPPGLAAAGRRACLTWTDGRLGDPDVFLRCSTRPGSWGSAQRVNSDPEGNGHWQYLPQVGLAANGRIDVAFYDRRLQVRNQLVATVFVYTYDGRNFSGNIRLSRIAFDATIGPRPQGPDGPADFGSRMGLLSRSGDSLVAWPDTRNGLAEGQSQDIYTARVTLLFAADRPGWAVPLGAALAVAGSAATGLALLVRRRTHRQIAPGTTSGSSGPAVPVATEVE